MDNWITSGCRCNGGKVFCRAAVRKSALNEEHFLMDLNPLQMTLRTDFNFVPRVDITYDYSELKLEGEGAAMLNKTTHPSEDNVQNPGFE